PWASRCVDAAVCVLGHHGRAVCCCCGYPWPVALPPRASGPRAAPSADARRHSRLVVRLTRPPLSPSWLALGPVPVLIVRCVLLLSWPYFISLCNPSPEQLRLLSLHPPSLTTTQNNLQ